MGCKTLKSYVTISSAWSFLRPDLSIICRLKACNAGGPPYSNRGDNAGGPPYSNRGELGDSNVFVFVAQQFPILNENFRSQSRLKLVTDALNLCLLNGESFLFHFTCPYIISRCDFISH